MATFNDGATHILSQNYTNGEAIAISNDTTVIIDADTFIPTNKWGNVTCTTIGELELRNAGTNGNMLVFDFNTISNNLFFQRVSTFKTRGALLEVATGDGTAGQTIDFSSVGTNAVSLNEVTCVWVEKTAGGELVPYTSLGDPTSDNNPMPLAGVSGQEGIGETAFGGVSADYDSGRYFNFNRTTKVATFGDGTNGLVIPNGCKVFISNIQITGVYDSNYINRSTVQYNSGCTLDLQYTEFTSSIYLYGQEAGTTTMNYVSIAPLWRHRQSHFSLILDYVALVDDPRATLWSVPNALYIESSFGDNNQISNLWVSGFYNGLGSGSFRNITRFSLSGFTKFENVWIVQSDKKNNANNAAHYCGLFEEAENLNFVNVTLVGGHIQLDKSTNCNLVNWRFKGTPFTPAFTTNIQKWRNVYALFVSSVSNCKIINYNQIVNTCPPYRMYVIQSFASGLEFFGGNWYLDTINSTWCEYFVQDGGDNNSYKNINVTGTFTTRFVNSELFASNTLLDNVGGTSQQSTIRKGSTLNLFECGEIDDQIVSAPNTDIGLFQTKDFSGGSGASQIRVEYGPPVNKDYYYKLNGTAYWDTVTNVYLPNIGDSVEIQTSAPLKFFTGFRNTNSYFYSSGFNTSTAGYFFKMSKAGDDLPASWTQLTTSGTSFFQNVYADLQAAFNALIDYDSDKGLNFAFKVENLSYGATVGYARFAAIAATYDTNYVSNDASITFGGGNATTKYEIIRDSDNAVLYTFIGTGTHEFFLDTNFNTAVYFKRYTLVNGSYALLLNTQYTTQNLTYGDNGIVPLYTGNEVQVASTDTQAIWEYTDRTLTEGGFTNTDRATLEKGLTTGKFLALK